MISNLQCKRIVMSADFVLGWMKAMNGEARYMKSYGIPEDAQLVDVVIDDTRYHTIALVIKSAEFPMTPEGSIPPYLDVKFTHHDPPPVVA